MKYIGYFKDLKNRLYTLNIITGGDSSSNKEITLGDSPFTTEMSSSGKTLYKSAKYQSATVNIVSDEYYFDMYSSKAHDNRIILYNSKNDIEWTGYLTPNVYNNSWEGGNQKMEIEAIDALSTLQYFKYECVNGSSKDVVSFTSILNKLLSKCDSYSKFYFSSNTKLTSDSTGSLIDNLFISEENFYDQKDDKETDEDVAWDMKNVLEAICLYMGVTVTAYKDNVYFIDYDAIKNGINTYYEYTINNIGTPNLVTLSSNYSITADNYEGSGQSISLSDVYNKVTVKDRLYTYDSVIPDIFSNTINITSSSDTDLASSTNVNNGIYGEVISNPIENGVDKSNNNMIVLLDRTYDPQDKKYEDYNVVFVKYFKNPYYKFYNYKWNGTSLADVTDSITSMNYTDSKSIYGAIPTKFCVKKLDKDYNMMEQWILQIIGKTLTLDDWLAKNDVTSISLTDYIMLTNPDDSDITGGNHYISNDDIEKYPFFETVVSDTTALFGGKNAYLLITGSYNYHYFDKDPYPIPEGEVDIREGRFSIDAGQTYILCKLQWGNLYWNGTGWSTTSTTFKLPYMKDDASQKDRQADATMFKDLDFINTVNWRIGTSEKGYLITLPSNKNVITGLPKLTVYKPFDPNYHSDDRNKGQHYKHDKVFLKNFNIKAIVGDPTFSKMNETDTKYTNIINADFINDLSDITFKICTWDNKKPNYSSVAYKLSDNNYQFLDKTYNTACYTGEQSWESSDDDASGSNGMMRQEEHLIYRLWNQYSKPSTSLEVKINLDELTPYSICTDKYLEGKSFITDELNLDYANLSVDAKLIEKR